MTALFRKTRTVSLLLLLAAATGAGRVAAQTPVGGLDLLDLQAGAVILSATGEYNEDWSALNLLDGTTQTGWSAPEGKSAPYAFVIELPRRYRLRFLVLDNTDAKESYPGISAREVRVSGSTTSATAGFAPLGTFEAAQGARREFPLPPPGSLAQWLKLEVLSNWGHAQYTEMMELEAYGEPEGEATAPPPIAGVYQTNYELMSLQQRGSRVVGCYDFSGGTLMGSTDGRVVQFEWREDQGTDIGTAIMVLSSAGDYLNGLWYRAGIRQGVWKGPRAAPGSKPHCTVRDAGGIGTALAESGRAIIYGIYFDSDSARLRPESEGALGEILALLKIQPGLRLLVEGHTDSTNSEAYNLKLSAERAQAVREWLVAREIAAVRLEPKGLGESRPVADNTTPQGRALNRRVEIVILK